MVQRGGHSTVNWIIGVTVMSVLIADSVIRSRAALSIAGFVWVQRVGIDRGQRAQLE